MLVWLWIRITRPSIYIFAYCGEGFDFIWISISFRLISLMNSNFHLGMHLNINHDKKIHVHVGYKFISLIFFWGCYLFIFCLLSWIQVFHLEQRRVCQSWGFLVRFWNFYLVGLMPMKTVRRFRRQKEQLVPFGAKPFSSPCMSFSWHMEEFSGWNLDQRFVCFYFCVYTFLL